MNTPVSLEELGPRICIMGPSNSGKSTLADAISRKTALPVVHLDLLHHLPDTNWVPRGHAEFLRLHADAVSQERWVMEGNYTKCATERLARATGLILLDVPVTVGLLRYIRRCYSSTPRIGGLRTGRENVTWEMIKYITLVAPENRLHHKRVYDQVRLPKLLLKSPHDVEACFQRWGLRT
ncbi:AAA family ATPase [Erwinia sp. MMLR14_017]|uniref:AAA family ATPase n=1 Tax=Erwinia sp. MMLR14_017 TaxID=3093842 RepID=UPI00298F7D23|nr:AAA family ATPase [Erwinia sp. MMLR14_017]MDW8845016.1 AAA family ATPase [Erwinia sp. MMLR14_017]